MSDKVRNLLARWLLIAGGGTGTWYAVLYFVGGRTTQWGPFPVEGMVGAAVTAFAVVLAVLGVHSWKLQQRVKKNGSTLSPTSMRKPK